MSFDPDITSMRLPWGLYVAGDIAQFPEARTAQPTRIEHWRLAAQQGRTAAQNMLGQQVKFMGVPFFWTGQFDLKLRYVGHATQWNNILIQGEVSEQNFLAFYVQDNQILAVCGCGRDQDIAAISELMRLQQLPPASAIRDQDMNWVDYLQSQV